VTITKTIDTASPMLYQACAEGKTLDELTIEWYRINDQGVEELYFTHTLKKVKVSEVKAVLPNTKDPKKERLTHLEEVKLMYEQISWKHEEGYEYEDSWVDNA
jgi:type VI secretion system secreted protein Hcp